MSNTRLRPAVRGLVMDPNNDVLMVKLVFPQGAWWVLPGGGIDAGENHHTALLRELREETGLMVDTLGPLIWTRVHYFSMRDTEGVEWDGQSESVYLVQSERFIPEPAMTTAELLRENLHEHKWWSIAELLQYDGPDNLSPPDIASYLHVIAHHGVPAVPFSLVHGTPPTADD